MSRQRHLAILGAAALSYGAAAAAAAGLEPSPPLIDNERVKVWKVTWEKGRAIPPEAVGHDTLRVYLSGGPVRVVGLDGKSEVVPRAKGEVLFVPRGEGPVEEGVGGPSPAQSILVELKDHPVAPLENKSGYPNAFPRPNGKKVLENDRVIVWSYAWTPGLPTPMHFHDKDVVVLYLEDTALISTTPDGKQVLREYKVGDTRFNLRDRIHSELLSGPSGSAVITELK